MTEAELAELDEPDEPNLPEALPGAGMTGTLAPVSLEKQRERRALMSGMLAQGAGRDAITAAFGKKFGMTDEAVRVLIDEVRAMWDDEDADHARYARSAARRRLHQSIREANKDRKFTAVANLEKVLADVEGTNVNEEDQPIDVDSRLSDALLHMLQQEDTKGVRLIIERERAIIELGGPDGTSRPAKLAPGQTIVEPGGG